MSASVAISSGRDRRRTAGRATPRWRTSPQFVTAGGALSGVNPGGTIDPGIIVGAGFVAVVPVDGTIAVPPVGVPSPPDAAGPPPGVSLVEPMSPTHPVSA